MNKTIIIATGLLLGSFSVQADDLTEVYELAKKNDPAYEAAIAQFHATKEASPRAWASVKPQLNVSARFAEVDEESRTPAFPAFSTNQAYGTDTYTLSLTQTIYNQAQFDAIRQASAIVSQAEADYANAKHELIIRVAQRYFNVLSESASLRFAQAEKKAIAQQLTQAKQRFKVGLTAITDVHEAQARYDQAVSSEIESQRLFDIAKESLRELTGQAHDQLQKLSKEHPLVRPNPEEMDSWVKTALNNNLPLLSARHAMRAAKLNKDMIFAGHYPTLDLAAQYTDASADGGRFGASERKGSNISLTLNIPIYSGGATSASHREAAAGYQQSKALYEQQRRATERLTRNSYLTVISSISQVKALKQALRSNRTALEATQAGFEVGTRTAVDVLNSQREMFRAQRDYIRARHDYILNTLQLKQAAGILADENVRLINAWLGG